MKLAIGCMCDFNHFLFQKTKVQYVYQLLVSYIVSWSPPLRRNLIKYLTLLVKNSALAILLYLKN